MMDPKMSTQQARVEWKQIKKALEKPQEFMAMILQYDATTLTPKVSINIIVIIIIIIIIIIIVIIIFINNNNFL